MTTKKQQARTDFINYLRDVAERGIKVFAFAYLSAWWVAGKAFDVLFTQHNVEAGVVGLALSVAFNLGLGRTNIGDNDSASVLNTK